MDPTSRERKFVRSRSLDKKRVYSFLIKTTPCDLFALKSKQRLVLYFYTICGIITPNMAIKVTRKDQGEANENIIRRFNRKVLQSGMMPLKKSQMRFTKPMSKRERRLKAIIREARKAEKTERIKLGLK